MRKKSKHGNVKTKKAKVSKVRMGKGFKQGFSKATLDHVIEHLHTLLGEVQKVHIVQNAIVRKIGNIMTKQSELADALSEVNTTLSEVGAQVTKIGTETDTLVAKVGELEAALNDQANLSPEAQRAFDAVKTSAESLKGQVQAVDDKVADAVEPEDDGEDDETDEDEENA